MSSPIHLQQGRAFLQMSITSGHRCHFLSRSSVLRLPPPTRSGPTKYTLAFPLTKKPLLTHLLRFPFQILHLPGQPATTASNQKPRGPQPFTRTPHSAHPSRFQSCVLCLGAKRSSVFNRPGPRRRNDRQAFLPSNICTKPRGAQPFTRTGVGHGKTWLLEGETWGGHSGRMGDQGAGVKTILMGVTIHSAVLTTPGTSPCRRLMQVRQAASFSYRRVSSRIQSN